MTLAVTLSMEMPVMDATIKRSSHGRRDAADGKVHDLQYQKNTGAMPMLKATGNGQRRLERRVVAHAVEAAYGNKSGPTSGSTRKTLAAKLR